MKKKNHGEESSPKDLAWKMFSKTGSVTYYHLYKKLSEKNKDL
jgi:hypothetical protein